VKIGDALAKLVEKTNPDKPVVAEMAKENLAFQKQRHEAKDKLDKQKLQAKETTNKAKLQLARVQLQVKMTTNKLSVLKKGTEEAKKMYEIYESNDEDMKNMYRERYVKILRLYDNALISFATLEANMGATAETPSDD
jgi:transcriptional accessory protein Tex/SPT6